MACQESFHAFVDECFDYLADKMRVQPAAANYINPLNTLAVMDWTTSPRNTQKKAFKRFSFVVFCLISLNVCTDTLVLKASSILLLLLY